MISPADIQAIAAEVVHGLMDEHIVTPQWMTLPEACTAFSLGKDRLKDLALSGRIVGGQDRDDARGTWRFEARSIHRYLMTVTGRADIESKTLDVMRRLGL